MKELKIFSIFKIRAAYCSAEFEIPLNGGGIDEISPSGRNDGRFTRKMGVFLRRRSRLKNTFSPSKMQKVISPSGQANGVRNLYCLMEFEIPLNREGLRRKAYNIDNPACNAGLGMHPHAPLFGGISNSAEQEN